jgi:DNA integrity scanning protein DisA with diadenylate cyclase activity
MKKYGNLSINDELKLNATLTTKLTHAVFGVKNNEYQTLHVIHIKRLLKFFVEIPKKEENIRSQEDKEYNWFINSHIGVLIIREKPINDNYFSKYYLFKK